MQKRALLAIAGGAGALLLACADAALPIDGKSGEMDSGAKSTTTGSTEDAGAAETPSSEPIAAALDASDNADVTPPFAPTATSVDASDGADVAPPPAPSVTSVDASEPPSQEAGTSPLSLQDGVDLLILIDRDGEQAADPELYASLTRGVFGYLQAAAASDTQVALQLYGRDDGARCSAATYRTPAVDFHPAAEAIDLFSDAIATFGLGSHSDTTPAPALQGALAHAMERARASAERRVGIAMLHREQDTYCANVDEYRNIVLQLVASDPLVPLFGVEIAGRLGEPAGDFSAVREVGNELGAGFSWRIEPLVDTLSGEVMRILAEIHELVPTVMPTGGALAVPDAPAPGTSAPLDLCRDIIRDDEYPVGECLDSHFENSCSLDFPPEFQCISLTTGCSGEAAYVGAYVRGCGQEAWVTLTCTSSEGGVHRGGGRLWGDPNHFGFGTKLGYQCACNPETGQAADAQLNVAGAVCAVKPAE